MPVRDLLQVTGVIGTILEKNKSRTFYPIATTMQILRILPISLFVTLTIAVDPPTTPCDSACGVVDGKCVKYYSVLGCDDEYKTEFKPAKCDGTCYTVSFDSLFVCGDGTYGTDCDVYSDQFCSDDAFMGSTGDVVTAFSQHCSDFKGAQSMQCYWQC